MSTFFERIKRALGRGSVTRSQIEKLSCKQVSALLYDYMDRELDPEVRTRVEAHVNGGACECGRALLMEIAFNEKMKSSLDCGSAPASLKRRIEETLSG